MITMLFEEMVFEAKLKALNIVPINKDYTGIVEDKYEYMYNSTEHVHVFSREFLESVELVEIQRKMQRWL